MRSRNSVSYGAPFSGHRAANISMVDKKLLVTCLQFLHNLTMGNDRLKMAFWFEMLFDNDLHNEPVHDLVHNLRVEVVYEEVRNWLRRNNTKSLMAEAILAKHSADVELGNTAGPLPPDELYLPGKPAA